MAILVESSRGYGRGLLRGITDYLRIHGPWSVSFEERDLGDPPPDWLADWRGQGVIARVETRALAKAISALGCPTIDLHGVFAVYDRDVAAAVRYIREHACEGIQVADVLSAVPLSRSVLDRRFTQVLGHSPKEEISRVRLQRIKQLLAETDLKLPQVAVMTGFPHPEYLSAMFKKTTGQTLGAFRAATRQHTPAERLRGIQDR